MRAITRAFHLLSVSQVQLYSLTPAAEVPRAIKQHGQVVRASALFFFLRFVKTAIVTPKTASGGRMSGAVKTETARQRR